ncbi:hypothetical protein CDV31_016811 [Fusarium ambrosium]|uniref:Methyltransferase type 11 domain-containing protein n=1 Tax=Fusarium ambrosium TaxID=131363 RepID=A0A428S202_9HYPO|nr:hypothetical protein CDV31_016811 [Fusarium ambrosium]
MTTSGDLIQTNEDIYGGWVIVGASTASLGPPELQEHEATTTTTTTITTLSLSPLPVRPHHFPIDQRQLDAQRLSHLAVCELLRGELHLADLKKAEKPIRRVLDVGSGEGKKAPVTNNFYRRLMGDLLQDAEHCNEFADDHPDMEVIGTDLSAIGDTWGPPNLRFEIEDCRQDWTFDDSRFDFIHMRDLVGGIKDWLRLFREAFRCTSPGGLIESHEHSFIFQSDNKSIEPGSALGWMGKIFMEAGDKTGYSFAVVDEGVQKERMEEAGFVDINEEVKRMSISQKHEDPRLREISLIAYKALLHDLEGRLLYVTTQILRWPEKQTSFFAMEVREQLKRMDVYVAHKIVVGRKPESGSN